ncbi:MAG TPA: CRTAC1 family protein [Pirellulaceae bacterium]|nr:CRTAC1 family protein [Pirellulaceae bacterium]
MNVRLALWVAIVAAVIVGTGLLAWTQPWRGGDADRAAAQAKGQKLPPWFEDFTDKSGLNFRHWCGDGGKYFFPEVMGSGIGLIDFDRDGDLDIFVVQGMPAGGAGEKKPPAGLEPAPTSRLYRRGEDGRHEDVTEEAGLIDHEPYGMGVAIGDVNNDGWPDLYVSKYGQDRLYLNREGRFEDITDAAGIDNRRWGTSACFVDYDRDGWLDLFVVNYVDYFPSHRCVQPNGQIDYCHPGQFTDAPAKLYRNVTGDESPKAKVQSPKSEPGGKGQGSAERGQESEVRGQGEELQVRFRDVSLEAGIDAKPGPGLGVIPGDFNGDDWIDLYVANDAKANFLWINQQGKSFRDEAIVAGAAVDIAGRPQSSMGVASGDVNGDGKSDLFMTHLDGEYSTLYLQLEDGVFEDRTVAAGLAAATIPYTGFGTALVDLDLDGDLDLPIANGRVRRPDEMRTAADNPTEFWKQYAERNQLFLGNGDGTFTEAAPGGDPFYSRPNVARGLAIGDLDGDGDLDMVTSEINGPARIYLNVAPRQGNWLSVRAVDPRHGGRDAYGALIAVVAGTQRWSRDINPAYSYLSSGDPRAHFGLGKISAIDRIEVRWPDGTKESFPGGGVNREVTIQPGEGKSP